MNKKLIADTVVILLITFLILFTAEMICRATSNDENKIPLYRFDPEILYTLKPNLNIKGTGDYDGVLFQTNADGFRAEPLNPSPDVRVIVYGDSNVMARWLNVEETFPYKLEEFLKVSLNKNVEILSSGTVGYGPDQELLLLEREADKYKPDLAVFVVFADNDYGDLMRNRLFEFDEHGQFVRTHFPVEPDVVFKEQNQLFIVKRLRELIAQNSQGEFMGQSPLEGFIYEHTEKTAEEFMAYKEHQSRQTSIFADNYDLDIALHPESESVHTKIALMGEVLKEAQNFASSKNIGFLVVVLPSRIDITGNDTVISYKDLQKFPGYTQRNLTGPLEKNLLYNGVRYLDLFDVFVKNGAERFYYKNDDNDHWNVDGQELAAKIAAEYIITNNLLEKK